MGRFDSLRSWHLESDYPAVSAESGAVFDAALGEGNRTSREGVVAAARPADVRYLKSATRAGPCRWGLSRRRLGPR